MMRTVIFSIALLSALPGWADGAKMETKTFRLPVDFLSLEPEPAASAPAAPPDPFAPPNTPPNPPPVHPQRAKAKTILEAQGIPFPEGSRASFDPTTGLLRVTNTEANLDLVDTFVGSLRCCRCYKTLSFLIQVFQLPVAAAQVIAQSAAANGDQTAELDRLTKAAADPSSNVRAISTGFVDTKSGNRTMIEAIRQHAFIAEADASKDGHIANLEQEIKPLGFRAEIDPVVGPDGYTIDVNLSFDLATAPPEEGIETSTDLLSGKPFTAPTSAFHEKHLQTALSLSAGTTKMLGIWTPTGKAESNGGDSRWVAFLTARLVTAEHQPRVWELPLPEGLKMPKDWKTVFFPIAAHLGVMDASGVGRAAGESVEHCLQRNGAELPPGSRIGSTPDGLLTVTSSVEALGNVGEIVWGLSRHAPRDLAFTFHTIRAPGAMIRSLVKDATRGGSARPQLDALMTAVAEGKAQCVDTSYLETKSGMRASLVSNVQQPFIADFIGLPKPDPEAKEKPAPKPRGPEMDIHPQGTTVEIDPVLGPDSATIDLTLSIKHTTAPMDERWLEFRDPTHSSPYRLPFIDTHEASIQTAVSLTDHSTKLLGIYHPTGNSEAEDVLEAVFITAEVTMSVAEHKPWMLDERPEHPTKPNKLPEGMVCVSFRVPADFGSIPLANENDEQNYPFPRPMKVKVNGMWPDGASSVFNPEMRRLVVLNTPENIAKVRQWLTDIWQKCPKTISPVVHLFEAPGPVLRKLLATHPPINDHRPLLDALRAASDQKQARNIGMLRLETKSGQRAAIEDTVEKPAISEIGIGADGQSFIHHDTRKVGLAFEVDPVIGPDGWTMDFNAALRYSPSAPDEQTLRYTDPMTGHEITIPQFRFHQMELNTAITMEHSTVKLLAIWHPTGPAFEGKDILQCALIEGHILAAE